MNNIRYIIIVSAIATIIGFVSAKFIFINKSDLAKNQEMEDHSLDKYSIESLGNTIIKPGQLTLDSQNNTFVFEFEPALNGLKKKTTGQIRIPNGNSKSLLRSYSSQLAA